MLMRTMIALSFTLCLLPTAAYGEKKCGCKKKNKTTFITQPASEDEAKSPSDLQPKKPVEVLASGLGNLPLGAKEGECYVRVIQPAVYKTEDERILIQPESVRYETIAAVFREVEKKVLIKPAHVRYEIVPAKFEKKMVSVLIQPEHKKLAAEPVKFKNVDKTYEIKPSRTYWTLGSDPINPDPRMTEEILCLMREPAEVMNYSQKVLVTPAKVNETKVEPRSQMIATEVLVEPAQVKEIKVPDEFKVTKVMELVTPARKKAIPVPARYETVKRKVLVKAEALAWQRVLCKTNITPEVVKKIQNALKKKGFDPGAANGELNKPTDNAIKQYQKANKLAQGGLSFEFLEHIGVKP